MIDLFTSSSRIKKNDTGTVYQSLTFENCLVYRKHMDVLLVYPFYSQYNKYVVRFSLISLKNNRIKSLTFGILRYITF